MAPSLALSLAHQPSSSTHASVSAGAWFRCMGQMSSLTWSRRQDSAFGQLFTFRSLVNSPSGLITTALLCLRLCHSLPATLSATISSPRLIVSLCLSFRPAPRVAPPLQSNMAAITGLPVGWGNKSLSPIAFYACVRASRLL